MTGPLIGITVSVHEVESGLEYTSSWHYSRAVAEAGGVPVLLPEEPDLAEAYAQRCDGFVLSGGDDPRMEPFGVPTHPQATVIHPRRQAFDLALLAALERQPPKPTLGICLGMQLMTLVHGGTLHQHLPEVCPDAPRHRRQEHEVTLEGRAGLLAKLAGALQGRPVVWSNHHQAAATAGRLLVTARGPGAVIEAVEDPSRPFYLGVQWHPERGNDSPLNQGLLASLVRACRPAT